MDVETAGPDALFVRRGDEYVATELTQGPWSPEHQHGGPVCALLATVVERVPSVVPMRCGRLTVDLMRTVPVAPLCARAEVVREGKRVQLVEAALEHNGVEVARASALRVRVGSTPNALTLPQRPESRRPACRRHTRVRHWSLRAARFRGSSARSTSTASSAGSAPVRRRSCGTGCGCR
jgi:hypothetical protein